LLADLADQLARRALGERAGALRARVSQLYPQHFVPVAMLPQSPGVDPATCIPELERCVRDCGCIGLNLNLNPDPSGGHWTSPPLTDRHWYPIDLVASSRPTRCKARFTPSWALRWTRASNSRPPTAPSARCL